MQIPPEWTDQFESGIQTIAVIQAGHGLLQLGSFKIIQEDLHFVLRMRQMFESISYRSGFYLSQLFSSNGTAATPSSSSVTNQQLQSQESNAPPQMLPPMEEHEDDIKWPNCLSLFSALTGRAEEASRHQEQNQMNIENQNELLSLESHHNHPKELHITSKNGLFGINNNLAPSATTRVQEQLRKQCRNVP
ncbi:hypothetical protein HID58_087659 [Brassica napus]|uniref:BnaC09g30260D protein n=2 Tax=Brassica napus TaxID=3708 RepID=A0A078G6D8_BRANA|nr:hypothetical protein HID58_087659 [Brassica napus]CAF1758076.1 unnamed protein product [Brassica napus]CDY20213.1 BnaC09g30260D [Brassica napus]